MKKTTYLFRSAQPTSFLAVSPGNARPNSKRMALPRRPRLGGEHAPFFFVGKDVAYHEDSSIIQAEQKQFSIHLDE